MRKGRREKVLIIRMSALGDVAMTLPVIYSVCRAYPDTDFFILTRPFFSKIFINAPKNLSVIPADLKTEYKGIGGIWRLLKSLSPYGFTSVADLHNVLRSWVISSYYKCKGAAVVIVDKARSKRRAANKKKIAQPSYIQRYIDVFDKLGFPIDLDFTSVFSGKTVDTPVVVIHPAVGIAPYARYFNKTYPPDMMRNVVEILTERGVNVYLFGAKGKESEELDAWDAAYDRCHSLAGKMPIAEELAMMSQMDVMVSMDSANQHLASLTGTRVLTVWGSTAPSCGFMAFGQKTEDTIIANLPCQPCTTAGSEKCPLGTLACLKSINPEYLAERIEKAITGM